MPTAPLGNHTCVFSDVLNIESEILSCNDRRAHAYEHANICAHGHQAFVILPSMDVWLWKITNSSIKRQLDDGILIISKSVHLFFCFSPLNWLILLVNAFNYNFVILCSVSLRFRLFHTWLIQCVCFITQVGFSWIYWQSWFVVPPKKFGPRLPEQEGLSLIENKLWIGLTEVRKQFNPMNQREP